MHLEALGVGPDRITVSGIPIDPIFAQAKDKRALRSKLGLRPDRTTILLSAGGYGIGKLDMLLTALLRLKHPTQVIAVCGHNKELHRSLLARRAEIPSGSRVSLHVVGYTTEMDEFMGASDLVVGKPGGLTTSEALAKGLVFVVVNPIPGQEERNSDHLLEAGAAIRCNNLPTLAYKIDQLLDQPRRFAALQANARRLGRPRAAIEIVGRLLELVD
jgi:processive 1,2-diacylglycerol beta-glucosyltransferase